MAAGDLVNGAVFRVSFFGLELGFSKVGGLSGSVEYDAYLEGGGRMHLLYRPSTSAGTITLEKGVSARGSAGASAFAARHPNTRADH